MVVIVQLPMPAPPMPPDPRFLALREAQAALAAANAAYDAALRADENPTPETGRALDRAYVTVRVASERERQAQRDVLISPGAPEVEVVPDDA